MMTSTTTNVTQSLLISVGLIITSVVVYYFYKKNKKTSMSKLITLKDSSIKYELPLAHKKEITHDTRLFRFSLPTSDHSLGLPIGQHIQISTEINGESVIRSYTPVSLDDELGFMDLVVKVYFRDVNPRFPEGGKLTQHLNNLQIGDKIRVRGPLGRIQYLGNGQFQLKVKNDFERVQVNKISMIAGGSGLTPMYQIIKHVLKNADTDTCKLSLLYANQSENDILLRKELDDFCAQFPDRLKVWYTIDKASEDWKYSTGYINEEMIANHLYPAGDDNIVLLCGPKPMIKFACLPNLEKLNFQKSNIFEY